MDNRLLESVKFTSSKQLQTCQRQLATARNTILKTALARPYSGLFSQREQETLAQAATILATFREKVAHAKEIRAGEEARSAARRAECAAHRQSLISAAFPQPQSADDHKEAVIFQLALGHFGRSFCRGFGQHPSQVLYTFDFIQSQLSVALRIKALGSKPYGAARAVQNVAVSCWRESIEWLDDGLWARDEIPSDQRLTELLETYRRVWRESVMNQYQAFLVEYASALEEELPSGR